MLRVCLRLAGGDLGLAEDVTQDVFIRLLHDLPRLERHERANIGGWLYRVAVTTTLQRLRRERGIFARVARRLRAEPPPEPPGADALIDLQEDAAAALAALRQLPPLERMVMTLKCLEDKSQQEIAEALDLSKGYVSKLVARACVQLRTLGWEDDDATP